MIDKRRFELIRKKYGHFVSWAVWANERERPTENIGDLRIFDLEINPNLLEQLRPNIIMVGLNISRPLEKPFQNFHDSRRGSRDYKIRFTFRNTPYYGAYMTDIIKNFKETEALKVIRYLKKNEEFKIQNIEIFRQEIKDLGVNNPFIIAFGNVAYEILFRNFAEEYQIVKIPHYSNFISKEKYREQVHNILNINNK